MANLKAFLKKYCDLLGLFGIFLLALLLRLNHLSLRPLWLDEACIANPIVSPLKNSWQNIIDSGNNAAYFYLLKYWAALFGDSEFALRALSVVLSLLAIIVIYKFACRLGGRAAGFWGAFLSAINYFGIFYSIQARHYSLVVLLSALSYYQFYLLLEDKKTKAAIWYIIFTALGIYTHPWFLLLLASQFIFIIFQRERVKILISQALILILSSPWIAVLWNYKENGANNWIPLTSTKTLAGTFHYFSYGAAMVYILFGVIAALFIVGRFKSTKERIYYHLASLASLRPNRNVWLLINYLFLPLLAALLIGHFVPFYEVGRYEAVVLPAFILLFALLFSKIKNIWLIGALVILLTSLSFSEAIKERTGIIEEKNNERVATSNLLLMAEDDDPIIFTGLSRPTIEYYLNHLDAGQKKLRLYSFPEEMAEHPAYQDIDKIIENNGGKMPSPGPLIQEIKSGTSRRVWLVFTSDNPFASVLRQEFQKQFVEQGYFIGPSYISVLYKF